MTASSTVDTATGFRYVLRLADDALIAAQRLAEWSATAPELEEDVALTNIALDELGQARLLLTYAGEIEGKGRDEDALAFGRDEREFVNCQLVELPNGDFAKTIGKLLCFAAYQQLLYCWLRDSTDERLAAIAAKAEKEVAYHVDHAAMWTRRLGDGTDESHRRMQAAVDEIWPYTHELFADDEVTTAVRDAGTGPDLAQLRETWLALVTGTLTEATLRIPDSDWVPSGGREGIHTEAMGYLLAEMQHLHRTHPGARW